MNLKPEIFGKFADIVTAYYDSMRETIAMPRMPSCRRRPHAIPPFTRARNLQNPFLRVIREEDDGVVEAA